MPYGRGGAGNTLALEQENARVSADLEANQHAAESALTGHASIEREEPKYAHSGRGGAGNYYSPQELSQTGHFSDAHRSNVLGDGTQAPTDRSSVNGAVAAPSSYNAMQASTQPTRTVGRGGAGNYNYWVDESEERAGWKRIDEEQRRERLKADIERSVKNALAEPPKAKLAGGEPF